MYIHTVCISSVYFRLCAGSKGKRGKTEERYEKMKQITLSDKETKQIDIYLELTSGRISEELSIWKNLQGKNPVAEKNIKFWSETAVAVSKLRKQLR